jgi:phosphoribosyl 1,2-cyclic phosphodiesterase
MHLQVLSSGSEGNCTLIRCGELTILVDAGLTMRALSERFEAARIAPWQIDHIILTHAHLDHSRSAGIVGKRHEATVHCPFAMMQNRSVARAKKLSTLPIGGSFELEVPRSEEKLKVKTVQLPHDCAPTVAIELSYGGRKAVICTDCGHPRNDVAPPLKGAHILVLEFNYDPDLLAAGPYPPKLQKRIKSDHGHLSNGQAQELLRDLVTPDLHTLVLAHLSKKTNSPELALAAARATLEDLGRSDVEVLVAAQHEIGPNLEV